MRNFTKLLLVFLFACTVGISYAQSDYKTVIEQAKSQNKIVLLDFYTDWCIPCKQMEKHIFSQKRVDEILDKNFIKLRVDAEKGEGIDLARNYNVTGYPTLIFVTGEDKEIGRLYGAPSNVNFFLEVMNIVQGKSVDVMALYESYSGAQGDEKLKFASDIAAVGPAHYMLLKGGAQKDLREKVKEVVDYYLKNKPLTEMVNQRDFEIISMFLDGAKNESPQIEFLYKNYNRYKEIVPEYDLAQFVVRVNNQSIQEYSRKGDLIWKKFVGYIGNELSSAYAFMGEKGAKELMMCVANINAALYVDKNFDRYINLRDKYTDLLIANGNDTNGNYLYAAQVLFHHSKGKLSVKQIAKGVEWLDKNIETRFNLLASYLLLGDFYALMPDKKAEAIYNYNLCANEARKQSERVSERYMGILKEKIDKVKAQ